ncbi:c-type heme family protein [Thalassoglobus sp.]|uniref:c-type heme family protein n=1 Tax=Thalassoglobus sp. TaxID=2795869 RepID=UPI003AA97EFD
MMNKSSRALAIFAMLLVSDASVFRPSATADEPAKAASEEGSPQKTKSVVEARQQAKLLHETVHGMLQIVHRDFFDEEESLKIPSASFEEVFEELKHAQGVSMRWISVNTEAMNVDNEPKSKFEKDAVKALITGKEEYESATDEVFQYVGTVRLSSRCLKCHVPRRSNNKDRAAGLVISIPLKKTAADAAAE